MFAVLSKLRLMGETLLDLSKKLDFLLNQVIKKFIY